MSDEKERIFWHNEGANPNSQVTPTQAANAGQYDAYRTGQVWRENSLGSPQSNGPASATTGAGGGGGLIVFLVCGVLFSWSWAIAAGGLLISAAIYKIASDFNVRRDIKITATVIALLGTGIATYMTLKTTKIVWNTPPPIEHFGQAMLWFGSGICAYIFLRDMVQNKLNRSSILKIAAGGVLVAIGISCGGFREGMLGSVVVTSLGNPVYSNVDDATRHVYPKFYTTFGEKYDVIETTRHNGVDLIRIQAQDKDGYASPGGFRKLSSDEVKKAALAGPPAAWNSIKYTARDLKLMKSIAHGRSPRWPMTSQKDIVTPAQKLMASDPQLKKLDQELVTVYRQAIANRTKNAAPGTGSVSDIIVCQSFWWQYCDYLSTRYRGNALRRELLNVYHGQIALLKKEIQTGDEIVLQ